MSVDDAHDDDDDVMALAPSLYPSLSGACPACSAADMRICIIVCARPVALVRVRGRITAHPEPPSAPQGPRRKSCTYMYVRMGSPLYDLFQIGVFSISVICERTVFFNFAGPAQLVPWVSRE